MGTFLLTKEDYLNGQTLCIDKPLDWTSFDVIKRVRGRLKKTFDLKKIKVGHAGTLDPKATGLLIVCTGAATKKISLLQDQTKTYTGKIKLGCTTASYDSENEEENPRAFERINKAELEEATSKFLGEILQKPPIYSAIKKDGIKMYERARAGETIEIEARPISIYKFEILNISLPYVSFLVECSKGTYIRSLANDFGENLGCGGYLSELKRTKIGNYSLEKIENETFEIPLL